jgi:hypothetical protein
MSQISVRGQDARSTIGRISLTQTERRIVLKCLLLVGVV